MATGVSSGPAGSLEAKMDRMLDFMEEKFGAVQKKLGEVEKVMGDVVKDVSDLKVFTKELGGKVEKNEKETQDQIKQLEETIRRQNQRLTNLEDRQRRRNIRLRNFKQDFAKGGRMVEAIQEWLERNNAGVKVDDIERAHWALGQRNQQQRHRDIVIAFGKESTAERVYRHLRSISGLNQNGNQVIVLRDLSQQTLRERAGLRPITACLFQHGIKFTWGFPTAILIIKGTETLRARTHEEGLELLSRLGISMTQQRGREGGAQGGGAAGGPEQQSRPSSGLSGNSGEGSSGRATPNEEETAAMNEKDERMRQLKEELEAMKRERKRMILRNARR